MLMSEKLQNGNRKLTDTPAPMDEEMKILRFDPRVTMHLLPLCKGHKTLTTVEDESKSSTSKPAVTTKPSLVAKTVKKTYKSSSKAKSLCPHELKGYKLTHEGKPICWGYNLVSGCKEKVENGRCRRGCIFAVSARRTIMAFMPAELPVLDYLMKKCMIQMILPRLMFRLRNLMSRQDQPTIQ